MDQNDKINAGSSDNESNNEVQSFIYQQIAEFEPFITPETLVMVIARNPESQNEDSNSESSVTDEKKQLHRIAIVLKEDEATIEAEALHDNIFEAIRFAKESLLQKLIQIQDEIEDPNDRLQAIQEARSDKKIH